MYCKFVLAFVVIAVSARSVDNAPQPAIVKADKIQLAIKPIPNAEDVTIPQKEDDSNSLQVGPTGKAMWNMQGMSECMLHYTALVYNGYGCYCGFGGSGTPVDGIDKCCMHHDNCYGDAIAKHGCTSSPLLYFDAYHWDCIDSNIYCRPGQSECEEALCACDKQFTICQSQFPKPKHSASCK